MKIPHAQLLLYTNIMYKFKSSTCKTVREKLWTKLCPWTDGRENCICTTSEQHLQKYRSNALDNNDLAKFTSLRGDNSTTNDSMVMKIAHA